MFSHLDVLLSPVDGGGQLLQQLHDLGLLGRRHRALALVDLQDQRLLLLNQALVMVVVMVIIMVKVMVMVIIIVG